MESPITMAVPEFYSGKILYPAIAVLLALSALFGLAILPRLAPSSRGMIGKPAPDAAFAVAANGTPGATMRVSELRGRPILLDFWASWCGPCAVEAPIIDRIARRYEKRGLVVMGVNVSDPPEVIRAYASRKGLSYPMVIDADKEASARYGVDKLPSLVLIDKEGKVLSYMVGMVDEASLNEILSGAL
jgi:cytochrome c biogenesis protein CcmG/thiol:disulfide interchange protein DsbE